MRPELKQFLELTEEAFKRHPVWVGCHTVDYDEEWYDDGDEETFRPWSRELPVASSTAEYLVRARVTFGDGSTGTGFLTPSQDAEDLGTLQPQVFVNGKAYGFWWGILDPPADVLRDFYAGVGKPTGKIFPVTFAVDEGSSDGVTTVKVDGFYTLLKDGTVKMVT
jgi:hypothetical protein